MKDNFFITRPVFAICISVTIVFLGILGLLSLPIEKYPDIAPPTVMVSASYPGASAETMQKAVAMPLEEAINGVENMTYMTSSVTPGSVTIEIYFKQGTNPDQASVNVQNKVSTAQGQLPSEVTKVGVTTQKRQISTLAILGIYSPDNSYDLNFISNYVDINVKPQIQRIQGVGQVMVMGSTYSMRIWLDPKKMASYKLVPADITNVLAQQNIEASTGSFGENSDNVFEYTMKYRGRYQTEEEFGNLVVRATEDGQVLHLKDVAKIEFGVQSYTYKGELNGHPGVTVMINQTAGSNATQINKDIAKLMKNVKQSFPAGLDYMYLENTNDFLFASIREVIKTMLEAILLVILVVFFFLQDYRLTLIPALSLVISLVGTFAALVLLGFSINLLTLFALILVIGTVVDDAIVVVEAVQARMEAGEKSSIKAANGAMHDISAAIITCTLVFIVVFIPVSFTGGTAGTFYKEFGLTMAVAVGISLLNALTLSPALCALLLKNNGNQGGFANIVRKAYNASYGALLNKYSSGIKFMIRKRWISWTVLACTLVLAVLLMKTTKTGLVPEEDTGMLFASISTSVGNSLTTTDKIVSRIEDIVKKYPEINSYSKVIGATMGGSNGSSSAMLIMQLKNWNQRKGKGHSAQDVMKRMNMDMASIKDAQVFVMAPSMIDGYGQGNAIELYVQDKKGGDINKFNEVAQKFFAALNKRPEIMAAFSQFKVNNPQYVVNIDAAKCLRAGISPSDVLDVLSGYYGSIYASNINRFSKVYRVVIQADPQYRLDPSSLDQVFVRNGSEMAPISNYLTLTKTYGPSSLTRFNLFNAISANVSVANGYSSGEAIKAISEVAKEVLPEGYSYEYGGMSREQSSSSNTVLIFIVCIVLVYLVLCSLYESFLIPFAVIFSVPFGILGCFLFAKLTGTENNIYLQTGMIMIIGLLAKTAILITEYATSRRKQGMSIEEAAFSAAKVRLRPILMTVLTLIFGMLPLLYASGAGANGDHSLGTGIIGGMTIGTIALLFVVPVFFTIFQHIQEKIKGEPQNENID
jgi:HAE1 family hydrophobic/amphiphilic exporter-1